MSYPPAAFRLTDEARLREHLADATLGLVATNGSSESGDGAPVASHVPFLFDATVGAKGVLLGHVARNNPHAKADGAAVLVVFQGPDAYISPSYYATKARDPRHVPTWDYQAIHVRGTLRAIDDAEWLRGVVTRLTQRYEARAGTDWQVSDAPADYIDRLLRGIVGLQVDIQSIEGRLKLSQNRAAEDQASVAVKLRASAKEGDRALGALLPVKAEDGI